HVPAVRQRPAPARALAPAALHVEWPAHRGSAVRSSFSSLRRARSRIHSRRRKQVRARLAKEEYATTWQEEEQGEPQTGCVARAEVGREAQREGFEPRAGWRV